jgi:diguanylate cyclase (GGDEF)-like protein
VALGLTNLRVREELRILSVRDSLTGLFNRRYFDETLQRELLSASRSHAPLTVLMLDLDHFKKMNDSLGHAGGDDVLRSFATLMRSAFRESDVICRYGGEEFAVILSGVDLEHAYAKAESFRMLVEAQPVPGSVGMTTSLGLASSNEFPEMRTLMYAADLALYSAKNRGRNLTCVCTAKVEGVPELAICAPPGLDGDRSLLGVTAREPNSTSWRRMERLAEMPVAAPADQA